MIGVLEYMYIYWHLLSWIPQTQQLIIDLVSHLCFTCTTKRLSPPQTSSV